LAAAAVLFNSMARPGPKKGVGLSYQKMTAIWGSSANDFWIAWHSGNGQEGLVHYTSSGVKKVTPPAGQYFGDIWGSSAQDIWVVGYSNLLLHYVF
jgi:hypothetical protein